MSKNTYQYEYLNRKRYTIHTQHRPFIKQEILDELEEYENFEFYDRKRMIDISENDRVQDEVNRLIKDLLEYRQKHEGKESNSEAMCQDQLMEFLSKLDIQDFRKLNIESLLTVPPEKTPEEKARDKKKREELQEIAKEHMNR